ncbi:MAG: DUF1330 domain-containing protein [Candidatus Competibacterales bacterium]|nr:DUF1330 domain-containing protein [Candidatus Competibacterales bacterium]
MPAYVLVEIDVHDTERYETYKQLAPAAIEAYGGRYLARGGRCELLEGDRPPARLVILEFPDLETAGRWLESPEYREARALRHATATTRMVAVEGVP